MIKINTIKVNGKDCLIWSPFRKKWIVKVIDEDRYMIFPYQYESIKELLKENKNKI